MSTTTTTLDRLDPGDRATILGLASGLPDGDRRRLMEIGLYPGTAVQVIRQSPLGDPVAYLVRGMTIALRREQARHVEVRHDG